MEKRSHWMICSVSSFLDLEIRIFYIDIIFICNSRASSPKHIEFLKNMLGICGSILNHCLYLSVCLMGQLLLLCQILDSLCKIQCTQTLQSVGIEFAVLLFFSLEANKPL